MTLRPSMKPVVGLLALLLLVAASGVPLLALLPAFVLIGFLSLGRDKGEALLGRLCPREERRRARAARAIASLQERFAVLGPRGSALLASGRAVRPPPLRPLPA